MVTGWTRSQTAGLKPTAGQSQQQGLTDVRSEQVWAYLDVRAERGRQPGPTGNGAASAPNPVGQATQKNADSFADIPSGAADGLPVDGLAKKMPYELYVSRVREILGFTHSTSSVTVFVQICRDLLACPIRSGA